MLAKITKGINKVCVMKIFLYTMWSMKDIVDLVDPFGNHADDIEWQFDVRVTRLGFGFPSLGGRLDGHVAYDLTV